MKNRKVTVCLPLAYMITKVLWKENKILKKHVEKRFLYLFTGESVALIGFIFVSYLGNNKYPQFELYSLPSFWISFFLLEFLLVQGSYYWFTKWKRFRREKTFTTPTRTVRVLKKLQKLNILIIVITSIVFILDFVKWNPNLPVGFYIALAVYVFSILEYINYFHIQLSYDNPSDIKHLMQTKKLKQVSLNKDFERVFGAKGKR